MNLQPKLIHWGTIGRVTIRTEDPFGNPAPSEITTIYSGQCRLVEKSERLAVSSASMGAAANTYITTYKLILPASSDVRERDTVLTITLENGEQVQGTYVVQSLIMRRFLYRQHHKVAVLTKVT